MVIFDGCSSNQPITSWVTSGLTATFADGDSHTRRQVEKPVSGEQLSPSPESSLSSCTDSGRPGRCTSRCANATRPDRKRAVCSTPNARATAHDSQGLQARPRDQQRPSSQEASMHRASSNRSSESANGSVASKVAASNQRVDVGNWSPRLEGSAPAASWQGSASPLVPRALVRPTTGTLRSCRGSNPKKATIGRLALDFPSHGSESCVPVLASLRAESTRYP